MPSHPERVRTASLPAGYQFGDAQHGTAAERYDVSLPLDEFLSRYGVAGVAAVSPATARERFGWRPLHLNAADRLTTSYATDYSKRSPYTTDRDLGDER